MQQREIETPVVRVEADLHCPNAGIAESEAAPYPLVSLDELARGGVGRDPGGVAPVEEPPERLILRAADEIPDGHFERPVASMMEVDGLEDPVHGVGLAWVASDEKTLEQCAIREAVAARVPLDAVVGTDDHDRRMLLSPRLRIPGGEERRIERKAILSRLDRGDAHLAYSPE
jgi:hypothetical protein